MPAAATANPGIGKGKYYQCSLICWNTAQAGAVSVCTAHSEAAKVEELQPAVYPAFQ